MTNVSFEIIKIDDSSYRIEEGGVRSLLFIGSERALLVDTGFGNTGSLKAVVDSLTQKPVIPVISHADPDHTGAITEFEAAYMHPAEMYRFQKDVPMFPLCEGDIVDLGGRSFEVFHIPGHTPGSIALLDRENRLIITGDTVSDGPVYMFGEGRSLEAYMESLKKLISMSDSFDAVFPSHGLFPLDKSRLNAQLKAAEMLQKGELLASEPPFPLPAKLYCAEDAMFFY